MKVKIGNSTITIGADGAILRGPRGYSAYEIAVQNGYKGTEEQWIEDLMGSYTAKSYIGLTNKPSVNNITLQGNKTLQELGITLINNVYLDENNILVFEFNNGQKIEVDLSGLGGGGLIINSSNYITADNQVFVTSDNKIFMLREGN